MCVTRKTFLTSSFVYGPLFILSTFVFPHTHPAADVTKRLLGTRDFLKEVGRQGGFRKDITAFHLRWIIGRGCPHVTAAFTFHKQASLTCHSIVFFTLLNFKGGGGFMIEPLVLLRLWAGQRCRYIFIA